MTEDSWLRGEDTAQKKETEILWELGQVAEESEIDGLMKKSVLSLQQYVEGFGCWEVILR
jgi:hypothetical protein